MALLTVTVKWSADVPPTPPFVASIRCRGATLSLILRATAVHATAVSGVAPAASAATGTLAQRVAMALMLPVRVQYLYKGHYSPSELLTEATIFDSFAWLDRVAAAERFPSL